MIYSDFDKYLPTGGRNCHLAIIPDGARRWAELRGVTLYDSYLESVSRIELTAERFISSGVVELSVLCSVIQNRNRPDAEVCAFITAGLELDRRMSKLAQKLDCDYRFIGLEAERNEDVSPTSRRAGVACINVVFDYDPFSEIASALRSLPKSVDPMSHIWSNLLLNRPIDFVIRTGGYKTLSNFFPLLIGYARMEFLEKVFNDLSAGELTEVFERFFLEPRRYGL